MQEKSKSSQEDEETKSCDEKLTRQEFLRRLMLKATVAGVLFETAHRVSKFKVISPAIAGGSN